MILYNLLMNCDLKDRYNTWEKDLMSYLKALQGWVENMDD